MDSYYIGYRLYIYHNKQLYMTLCVLCDASWVYSDNKVWNLKRLTY